MRKSLFFVLSSEKAIDQPKEKKFLIIISFKKNNHEFSLFLNNY